MRIRTLYFSASLIKKLYILICVSAIFLGGLIYIFLRNSDPLFFSWVGHFGLDNWMISLRQKFQVLELQFPHWFVNSLPNGLWAFAYACLIMLIWTDNRSWLRTIWISSIPVLVFGFELMQYFGLIKGTFSILDLVFGAGGIVIGYIAGSFVYRSKCHKKLTI